MRRKIEFPSRPGNIRTLCRRYWPVERCVLCGVDSALDAHHLGSAKNHKRENLCWLCRNCHWQVHEYGLPVYLLKRLRQWRHRTGGQPSARLAAIKRKRALRANVTRGKAGRLKAGRNAYLSRLRNLEKAPRRG